MPLLKRFQQKHFNEIYLLTGEIVTIFDTCMYSYIDPRRPDVYQVGFVKITNGSVDFGPLPPAVAVLEAYEILGYKVQRQEREM